jgi:hypothetical protein
LVGYWLLNDYLYIGEDYIIKKKYNLNKIDMKKMLLCLLILVSISVSGQVKREKFIEKYAGNLKITYQKTIDVESNDIRYGVFLLFQNDKYKTLDDTKIVLLTSVVELEQCKKDVISAFKQMFSGKVDMSWVRDKYKINLYDFSGDMYFTEGKGTGGYTIMSRRAVSDFIEILSTIDFGKDILLPSKTIDKLIP